jgi:hypothetical protein
MNIEIIGGGTVSHVRNHLALCAPAYGTTAKRLGSICYNQGSYDYQITVHLTKMAGGTEGLETNEDVSKLVDTLVANRRTKIIFFNPALVDFQGCVTQSGPIGSEWSNELPTTSGKYEERLQTSKGEQSMLLWPSEKILSKIRKGRKDIFLVAFKTTCGATEDEQFLAGLHLLKTNSCNLVLANDTKTRTNMIITPEQARYHVSTDREMALQQLVKMSLSRAKGTFTRSDMVPGFSVPWDTESIPHSLKAVVDHCIAKGAYKIFNGSTVGHFAFKKSETDFITSKRRADFNQLPKFGMVLCRAVSDNQVIAFGAKPSVGGQSQRIIFKDHPDMDCIVHFHCPHKPGANISTRNQSPYECGSHECGKNTSDGLQEVAPGIKCVYLDNHGPNIVFNHKIEPQKVIDFITRNFYLSQSTDQLDRSETEVV